MDLQHHFPTFVQHTTTLLGRYRALPKVKRALLNLLILLLAGFVAYWIFLAPPPRFPVGAYVTVEKGSTVTRAAEELKRRDIVRSAFLFKLSVRLLGDDTRASSGTYYFPQPQNLVTVAARLLGGDYGTTPIRITVPEGSTVNDFQMREDSDAFYLQLKGEAPGQQWVAGLRHERLTADKNALNAPDEEAALETSPFF